MDLPIGALTAVATFVPIAMLAGGLAMRRPVAGPVLFVLAIYALIAIGLRPVGFEVSPAGLRLRWIGRSIFIPRSRLQRAELIDRGAFRDEFGSAVRVGAGGFLGGFGYAWTRRGWVDLEVSRMSGMVLIRTKGRPLLLTPEDPQRFVDHVNEVAS